MAITRTYFAFIIPAFVLSHTVAGQTKWYSLIIGVKNIDQARYGAKAVSYPAHSSGANDVDVYKMKRIALDNDHRTVTLTDEKATRVTILDTLESIGKAINEGDGFLFYFSGHADAVPDTNDDERDDLPDQALVAYDGLVLDDEVHALITKYFNKTRNVFIVDACYPSASFNRARYFLDFSLLPGNKWLRFGHEATVMKQRIIPPRTFHTEGPVPEKHNIFYFGSARDHSVVANQRVGGAMTYWVSRLYRDSRFHGSWRRLSYLELAFELSEKMREHQHILDYHEVGDSISINQYRNQIPFKL